MLCGMYTNEGRAATAANLGCVSHDWARRLEEENEKVAAVAAGAVCFSPRRARASVCGLHPYAAATRIRNQVLPASEETSNNKWEEMGVPTEERTAANSRGR